MPNISNDTVIIAYDVTDDDVRTELREYLKYDLGAKRRTESVYEFIFDSSQMPKYKAILMKLSSVLSQDITAKAYAWDFDNGQLRRIAIHDLA
jgi:CRISPR-associated endonuclease Cas2